LWARYACRRQDLLGPVSRVIKKSKKKLGVTRKVDIGLPGKENSDSHGARPVYLNHLDDHVDSDQ